jgi:hypothetical protein
MVCEYSIPGLVSSGKHKKALDPGAAEGGGDTSHIASGTIIVGRPVRYPHPSPSSPVGLTQQMYGDPGRPRDCRYLTLSSGGCRIITLSRVPGRQMAGTAAERHSVTDQRAAGGVVWHRRLPRTAKPPGYGNRRTVVDRKNGSGSAGYSASPKIAVTCPRRIGRRWT